MKNESKPKPCATQEALRKQRLIKAAKAGVSISDIAERFGFGMNGDAVRAILRKAGVEVDGRRGRLS